MQPSYILGRDGFIWFIGVVEDRDDPSKLGRVRVRCFGYHTDDLNLIKTSDLPWAHVMLPTDTSSLNGLGTTPSFLVEGSWVVGFFRDPDLLQEPVIIGSLPGVPTKGPVTGKGFDDPSGKYPLRFGEPDTNRLAVNDSGNPHPIISVKGSVTSGVSSADGSTWSEPKTKYNAKYPYNHVFESESGHVKEYDDTEGVERISEYHKSGSFYEIHPDGSKVTRIVKDNYEIIAGDGYVNIKGNANIHVNGNCNISTDGEMKLKAGADELESTVLGETLKEQLEALIDAITQLTVPTAVGPSGPPINSAQFQQVASKLSEILSKNIKNN